VSFRHVPKILSQVLLALVLLLLAASSPAVSARIPTGEHPCGAVAARGAVWAANDGSGTLARIDPKTNRVTRRVRVGRGACSVAAGAGALWVTNYRTGTVTRVNTLLATHKIHVGGEPFDVLVAGKHVWASVWADGKLADIAPGTSRVVRRIDVGPYPAGLLAFGGALWVGFGRDATSIARVNTSTGTVTRVPVGVRSPTWISAGSSGDIWITADDNALVHLDTHTGRVLSTTRFGRTLGVPALGPDGKLWVPDKEIDRVFRVDPDSGRPVQSFPGGDGALFALRAFGSMWVTSYAGSDVWRFR
jgi:streptogramin lyase